MKYISVPIRSRYGGTGQDTSAKSGLVSLKAGTWHFIDGVVDVAAYATGGSGTVGAPWTGWDAAITWSGSRIYFFRPGHFTFTTTILIANDDTHIQGAGIGATVLHFEPTAADTAWELHKGASMLVRSSIGGFLMQSADTTFKKIGIDLVDVDICRVHDIEIGPEGYWTGATSVALRTRGREAGTVARVGLFADVPIQISDNPNSTIDLDQFHFTDCYLIANGNPNILIDSGVNLLSVIFDGYQAWVKGTHGLQWIDTATTTISIGLRINNVRWEQCESITGYFLDIEHNYGLHQLLVQNVYGGLDARGFKLRNAQIATFQEASYIGTGIALDADNTNYNLLFDNCFFQAGSTLTTTGLTKTYDSGQSTYGGTINNRVIYDVPSGSTEAVTMVNTTVSARMKIPVVATASLPAAASANDGLVLIEETGAATCNVVFYKNARRFKVAGTES